MKLERSYTSGYEIADDGEVRFRCSTDSREWPWLDLGPRHPVTVQAQNFWASIGAGHALGTISEDQWSALTWTDWQCGDRRAGNAVRGVYGREVDGDNENFRIELFDQADRPVVMMRGRGVVFRNRNFEEWREQAKAKIAGQANADNGPLDFAPREALGLGEGEHPLVASPDPSSPESFTVLVARENALPPANRVLSGSGDHVNSVHMIEAARQAQCLITGDPQPEITGGEMSLTRYVELGTPFRLNIAASNDAGITFALEQVERPCAEITLRR